jgi:N-acetylneuraminic acid mutarotase
LYAIVIYFQGVQTKNSCYLFGGVDTNTNELAENKIYKFTESINELEDNLSNNPICMEIPDECFATKYHVMFEYENNIYIQGGKQSSVCGQFFMFNTSDYTVELINDADSDDCCRYGHSVVVCNDKAYFFGGKTHHGASNTLCMFDLTRKKWIDQPKANGEWPNELTFHTAVLYDEKMYLFGGKTKNDTPSGILYEINLKKGEKYFCRVLYRENAPSARFGHVCYVKEDSMHVLGGYSSTEEVDPWIGYKYSFTTNTWTSYRLETPCGVFASVLHAEKAMVIGGTFWNRIKSTDLELLNEDILVSILQFLPVKDILEIQLLNKNLSLCHATQSKNFYQH